MDILKLINYMKNYFKKIKIEIIILLLFLITFPLHFLFIWMNTGLQKIISNFFNMKTFENNFYINFIASIVFLVLYTIYINKKIRFLFFIFYILFLSFFLFFEVNNYHDSIYMKLIFNSLICVVIAFLTLLLIWKMNPKNHNESFKS